MPLKTRVITLCKVYRGKCTPTWHHNSAANGHAHITSSLQSISRLFAKMWLDTYLSVVLLNLNSRVPFTMLKIVFVKVSPLILSNE